MPPAAVRPHRHHRLKRDLTSSSFSFKGGTGIHAAPRGAQRDNRVDGQDWQPMDRIGRSMDMSIRANPAMLPCRFVPKDASWHSERDRP
jgi:hypothetical protein